MRNIYLERERMEMKMKKIKNGCSCLGPCFSLYYKKNVFTLTPTTPRVADPIPNLFYRS